MWLCTEKSAFFLYLEVAESLLDLIIPLPPAFSLPDPFLLDPCFSWLCAQRQGFIIYTW